MEKDEYVNIEDICLQVQLKEGLEPQDVIPRIADNQKELAEMCAVLSITNMVRFGKMNSCVFKAIAEAALEFHVARERGITPTQMINQAMEEANKKQKELLKECIKNNVPHTVASFNYTDDGIEVETEGEKVEEIKKGVLDA